MAYIMSTYLSIAGLVLLSLGYLIWKLYPTPLPGIPYTAASTRRLLGDIADIKAQTHRTGESSLAVMQVARRLGSPIAQLLTTSFGKSVIIIDDAREVEDILLRRNREFDRSPLTAEFFKSLLPHSTIVQPTTPHLKAQKHQWSDVMGVGFLRRVVAPNIQKSAVEVVALWLLRAVQAGGAPFAVDHDFDHAALDAIWVAVFGSYLGITRREIETLQTEPGETDPADAAAARIEDAAEFMNDLVESMLLSLLPRLTLLWKQLTPRFRRFLKTKNGDIRRLMVTACERFQRIAADEKDDGEAHDTCAMDLVLRREMLAAVKAGRPPTDPAKNPALLDELLLMLLAVSESGASRTSPPA